MDKYELELWQKVKAGLEEAGKTDCHYYTRACAIVSGLPDPHELPSLDPKSEE